MCTAEWYPISKNTSALESVDPRERRSPAPPFTWPPQNRPGFHPAEIEARPLEVSAESHGARVDHMDDGRDNLRVARRVVSDRIHEFQQGHVEAHRRPSVADAVVLCRNYAGAPRRDATASDRCSRIRTSHVLSRSRSLPPLSHG